jgi:cytochrome c biogenesis protein
MKLFDQIWDFFASVKLAIFTLFTLSITAIIGTVIPQGENAAFYVKNYGAKTAQFFQILDIGDMYNSWWFLTLLGVLTANLIVCSFERIPRVWGIIQADNLALSAERIEKMAGSRSWTLPPGQLQQLSFEKILTDHGWPATSRRETTGTCHFSQRGRWSRLGVYIVHGSILVIFIGAAVGEFFGYKGTVMLPELVTAGQIFATKTRQPIPLGFEVRCDSFIVEFYDNGMPKTYRSQLTIIEEGKEVLTRDIEVNTPLTYRGITFYQSSYQGYQDFIVRIQKIGDEQSGLFNLPFQQQEIWEEKGIQFGIVNAEAIGQRVVRAKLWFKPNNQPAVIEWFDDNRDRVLQVGDDEYRVLVKQMYATGLQVAKDPGVWIVYLGCGLMMVGLYMAFFMSHRRVWLYCTTDKGGDRLVLAGSANKNKQAFVKTLTELEQGIDQAIQG